MGEMGCRKGSVVAGVRRCYGVGEKMVVGCGASYKLLRADNQAINDSKYVPREVRYTYILSITYSTSMLEYVNM